jgi:hypothetical protein
LVPAFKIPDQPRPAILHSPSVGFGRLSRLPRLFSVRLLIIHAGSGTNASSRLGCETWPPSVRKESVSHTVQREQEEKARIRQCAYLVGVSWMSMSRVVVTGANFQPAKMQCPVSTAHSPQSTAGSLSEGRALA